MSDMSITVIYHAMSLTVLYRQSDWSKNVYCICRFRSYFRSDSLTLGEFP